MFIFENLLRNEYFPSELPPCFNSESFADNYIDIMEYVKEKDLNPSDPLTFSGYKNANSRRKFAIPNPLHYARAAYVISNKSSDIFEVYEKGIHSLTVPLEKAPDKNECYKRPTKRISDSKEAIKKLYQNNQYEIRIDIQSFFESVYTHSIAWAMHSKTVAKRNKSDKTLTGNLLDKCLQNMNSGQTNGILVGNAISRIVSEIILCSVDKAVKQKIKDISYLRYVDDYYIFVPESSSINEILATFRQELAKYELMLNENKLQIIESPFFYGKPWVEQMQAYANLKPQVLLEKAVIEYHAFKDISILKYALNVIRSISFSQKEWKNIQPNIFNIWVKFPSLSNTITLIFKNNEDKLSQSLLKKSIYSILDSHILLKNDEEIIWATWMCKVFSVQISQEYIKKLFETDNWLAITILLDILSIKKSETSIKKIIDKFRTRLIEEYFKDVKPENAMFSDVWLLAYEADKNKWLNTSGEDTFLYARKEPFFKKMKESDIDFYMKDYEYTLVPETARNNIYVTRNELFEVLKEYQSLFETKLGGTTELQPDDEVFEELFDKVSHVITKTDSY